MQAHDLLRWTWRCVLVGLLGTFAGTGCQSEDSDPDSGEGQARQALALAPTLAGAQTLTYDAITGAPRTYTEANLLHTNLTDHWHAGSFNGDAFIYGHSGCCSENGQITHALGLTFSVDSLRIRQGGTAVWKAYNASGTKVGEVTITALSGTGSYDFPPAFQTALTRIDIQFPSGQFGCVREGEGGHCGDPGDQSLCTRGEGSKEGLSTETGLYSE